MLYLVIPTFGNIEHSKNFIDSFAGLDLGYKIILTDDHPDLPTCKAFSGLGNVEVLVSKEPLWWVGSINLGVDYLLNNIKIEDNDIVVFANNDVKIDRNSITKLYEIVSKDRSSIFHPRTFDENSKEVSSGAKILSLFPYVTMHPVGNSSKDYEEIDMGTARFLIFSAKILKKVGSIDADLVQYGGDNYFTLKARKKFNIKTYIVKDAVCSVDNNVTGEKLINIKTFKKLFKSFRSVKSPNNIYYKHQLFKPFYGRFLSFFIVLSMAVNTIFKFIIIKTTR